MTKKLFGFSAALMITLSAMCQFTDKKTAGKISFASINQVGFLSGETGQAAAVQSINGVSVDGWFTGIGAGIDYYGTRGIPLFIDVRRALSGNDKGPFLYADGGVHVPWATKAQNENKLFSGTYKKGAYFDGGIGLKLPAKNIGELLLSAGFSYKKVTEKAEVFTYLSSPTPVQTYEYYTSQYRRIMIKVGLRF